MPSLSIPTSIFGTTIAKVAVVVAFLAIGGVAAAQIGALDAVVGSDNTNAIEQVPDGVDTVASFDASVLEDGKTNRLYVTAYNATVGAAMDDAANESDEAEDEMRGPTSPAEMVPANASAALDRVENESGLDPRAVDEVVVFQQHQENYTQPQYSGAIVHTDWNKSTVVDAVSNSTDETYVNTTVNGVTVYQPEATEESEAEDDIRFGAHEPEQWVAVLDDGEYVFGTEQAVNDTIQVAVGEADPVDGDLRSAYDDTKDGYVRYAQRSRNVNVTRINQTMGQRTGLNVTAYAQAYNDLHVTAGSYYLTDNGLGFESRTLTNSTDTARDVQDLTQGFISIQAGAIQNETIEDELRSTEVTRDGTTVTVTRETSMETATKLIKWFGSAAQADQQSAGIAAQPIA